MTRRQRHNRILICITFVFFVALGYSLLIASDFDFRALFITCGAYALFVLLYSVVCWLDVPKKLRSIPDKPTDFKVLRLGSMTENVASFLSEAKVTRDQIYGEIRHQLLRVDRKYPEGIWSCEIEVADDCVLAFATFYESVESPVLDRSEQIGEGRFLVVPG